MARRGLKEVVGFVFFALLASTGMLIRNGAGAFMIELAQSSDCTDQLWLELHFHLMVLYQVNTNRHPSTIWRQVPQVRKAPSHRGTVARQVDLASRNSGQATSKQKQTAYSVRFVLR